MPNPDTHPKGETKRLRRAVKRRRVYADNLKASAAAIMADMPTDDRIAFAERLRDLADAELATAREEQKAADALETRHAQPAHHPYSSQEMKERADRAMKAVAGRLSIDRAHHMLDELGISHDRPALGEAMNEVEKTIGIQHLGDRPLMGIRIQLAETRMYGEPRF